MSDLAKDRLRLIGMLYEQLEADIHDHEVDAIHDLLWHIPEHAIFEYFEADREDQTTTYCDSQ